MDNRVTVCSFSKQFVGYEKNLEKIALSALGYLKEKGVGVDVFLVGNPRMRGLNNSYLGKDAPTNVISIEAPPFPNASSLCRPVGEIYLCPPYIREHRDDIEYMLIHGLLHLLGFLHETKSDRMVMETAERKIISYVRGSRT